MVEADFSQRDGTGDSGMNEEDCARQGNADESSMPTLKRIGKKRDMKSDSALLVR
jgi:hypothetical protein